MRLHGWDDLTRLLRGDAELELFLALRDRLIDDRAAITGISRVRESRIRPPTAKGDNHDGDADTAKASCVHAIDPLSYSSPQLQSRAAVNEQCHAAENQPAKRNRNDPQSD
jgi:hypothetical protein